MSEIRLNPGAQTDFFVSTAPYAALIGGRGCAKSAALVIKSFTLCIDNPGIRGVLTAPTAGMGKNILLEAAMDFYGDQRPSIWAWKEKEAKIVFVNGSQIWLRPSAEADTFRGMNIAFAGMDEAGIGNQYPAFKLIDPALRQPKMPHYLWIATTPKAESSWLKFLWQDGIHPDTREPIANPEQYEMFPATMYDNPHLTDDFIYKMEARYPKGTRDHDQEILGKFISVEGVAFPDIAESTHLKRMPDEFREGARILCGLDRGAASPTSLHKIYFRQDLDQMWIKEEFYKSNASDYDWGQWAAENDVHKISCDPSYSEQELQSLRRKTGIDIRPAMDMRGFRPRYNFWSSRLGIRPSSNTPGLYIDPEAVNLWNEMLNLQYAKSQGEFAQDKWAPGVNDHAYDDCAYAGGVLERGILGRPKSTLELVRVA